MFHCQCQCHVDKYINSFIYNSYKNNANKEALSSIFTCQHSTNYEWNEVVVSFLESNCSFAFESGLNFVEFGTFSIYLTTNSELFFPHSTKALPSHSVIIQTSWLLMAIESWKNELYSSVAVEFFFLAVFLWWISQRLSDGRKISIGR